MNKHFFSESSVINFFCDVLGVGTNVFSHKEKRILESNSIDSIKAVLLGSEGKEYKKDETLTFRLGQILCGQSILLPQEKNKSSPDIYNTPQKLDQKIVVNKIE